MTLRHLQIFVAVYQENSITKAADKFYISQPAVSKYIREIEDTYGGKLFECVQIRDWRSSTCRS